MIALPWTHCCGNAIHLTSYADDMELSEDSSDWSDEDIIVRSDTPAEEADAEGEEEEPDEIWDCDGGFSQGGDDGSPPAAPRGTRGKSVPVKLKIRTINGVRGIDFFCLSSIQVWCARNVTHGQSICDARAREG